MRYDVKSRVPIHDNPIPDEVILKNLVHKLVQDMNVEDMKRIFHFKKEDPNDFEKELKALYNLEKENSLTETIERKQGLLDRLSHLKHFNEIAYQISIEL